MAGFTTYSDIGQRTTVWAEVEMLSHAEPILVLERWGLTKPLPRNKAETVKFRRPIPFPVTTTALTEGVTPPPQAMRYEDISVTMQQYGAQVQITDRVADLSEDPVLKDAAKLCGEQAAETKENIIWGVIRGGTNVNYTGTATARGTASGVNTVLTTNDQRGITRALKLQRAKYHTSMLSGSPNYSTEPVDSSFIAFAHTDCESDIRNMSGFVPREKYGQATKIVPGEIGKVEDVRYVISPVLSFFASSGNTTVPSGIKSTDSSNVDVYPIVYLGREAYGNVPLKGAGSLSPQVQNPGQRSPSDPLGQRGYVSWKMWFACVRLNEAWMQRLETAVSDL